MGCTPFGEHWNKGTDDLLIDAAEETFASAGIDQGRRRRVLARHRDVGHERHGAGPPAAAARQAGHARRELLRDRVGGDPQRRVRGRERRVRRRDGDRRREGQGQRLPGPRRRGQDADRRHRPHAHRRPRCSRCARPATARSTASTTSRCARCSPASRGRTTTTAPATRARSSRRKSRWRRSATRRSWRAGSACTTARVWPTVRRPRSSCRAEDAHKYTDKPIYIKALSLVAGNCSGNADPAYDYTTFPEIAATGRDAYAQAGVTNPREQIAMAEVHDCFTPGRAAHLRGPPVRRARQRVEGSARRAPSTSKGDMPVNPDGGLKSFGHPVGASGLRMMFEAWLQLRGEAPRGAARSADDRGRSRSRTTSAATPARWCRSCRFSAASSGSGRRSRSDGRGGIGARRLRGALPDRLAGRAEHSRRATGVDGARVRVGGDRARRRAPRRDRAPARGALLDVSGARPQRSRSSARRRSACVSRVPLAAPPPADLSLLRTLRPALIGAATLVLIVVALRIRHAPSYFIFQTGDMGGYVNSANILDAGRTSRSGTSRRGSRCSCARPTCCSARRAPSPDCPTLGAISWPA